MTIAVAKDIPSEPLLLAAAWAAFLVSIVCGIWALYALVVEISPGERLQDEPTLAASGVRTASFSQIGAFLVGTAFRVAVGWSAASHDRPPAMPNPCPNARERVHGAIRAHGRRRAATVVAKPFRATCRH